MMLRLCMLLLLCSYQCCTSKSVEISTCSASGVCTARDKDLQRTEAILSLQSRKLQILTELQGQENSKADVNKLQRELNAIDSETASLVLPTTPNTMTASVGQRTGIRQPSDLSLHQYMEKSVQYETNYTIADARFAPFKIRYARRNNPPVLTDRGKKGQSPGRNHGTPLTPAIVRTVSVLDFRGKLHFLLRRDRELTPSISDADGETVDRTSNNNAYDNEESTAMVISEIREVFTLDLEHTRKDGTEGGHNHVTSWIFEGKDVESPMVVSAGIDGQVHVSFLQVFDDMGMLVAGRRVSSTIAGPMPTATSKTTTDEASQSSLSQSNTPVDGTIGGSKSGMDVGTAPGPKQPLNEGDEWSVDGRVQYRFRIPLLSTSTVDSTSHDNINSMDSIIPYVTSFCVGQLRAGLSVQVYAGDSAGRLHRMLIPYPITTSSDGRPILNTKTMPDMAKKGQQQQKKVDQNDQLLLPTASGGETATSSTGSDDQRGSGASPVLIVESLPPYNTAGPVIAVATTGPVIAIAYQKVIRMVRIANKGFELNTQSCIIDAPILGNGFEITPTNHTITSIAFDKKNPSLILAKLNNGDVAVFDTRTKFRGKGMVCAKINVIPSFNDYNATTTESVSGVIVPVRGHAMVAEGCDVLLYRTSTTPVVSGGDRNNKRGGRNPVSRRGNDQNNQQPGGNNPLSPSLRIRPELLAKHNGLNCSSHPPPLCSSPSSLSMVGCINSLHIDSLAPLSSTSSRQQASHSSRGPTSSSKSMAAVTNLKPEILLAFSRIKEESKHDSKQKKNQRKKDSNSVKSLGGDDGGSGVVVIYSSFLEPVEVVPDNIWSSLRMPLTVGVLLLVCIWHFSRQKKSGRTVRGRGGAPLSKEAMAQLKAAGITEDELRSSLMQEAMDPHHRRVIPPVNTFGAADDSESYLRAKAKMGLTRRTCLDDDDDDD